MKSFIFPIPRGKPPMILFLILLGIIHPISAQFCTYTKDDAASYQACVQKCENAGGYVQENHCLSKKDRERKEVEARGL